MAHCKHCNSDYVKKMKSVYYCFDCSTRSNDLRNGKTPSAYYYFSKVTGSWEVSERKISKYINSSSYVVFFSEVAAFKHLRSWLYQQKNDKITLVEWYPENPNAERIKKEIEEISRKILECEEHIVSLYHNLKQYTL